MARPAQAADPGAQAAFWDRLADRYAAMTLADPAAYAATMDRVAAHLRPGDHVREIGCGTGATALRLAPRVARYEASDLSPRMIALATARPEAAALPGLSFRVAPADAGSDRPLDAVLAFNLLHLLPDLPAALATIHATLRPGGVFLSKTPCLAELTPLLRLVVPAMQLVGRAPRLAWLRRATLEWQIAEAGFELLEAEDLPARRAQRFIAARRR